MPFENQLNFHDVTIFYDNVACLQIAQYVNSRHWDNFSTQHSF